MKNCGQEIQPPQNSIASIRAESNACEIVRNNILIIYRKQV
jgi:hypothetical protein